LWEFWKGARDPTPPYFPRFGIFEENTQFEIIARARFAPDSLFSSVHSEYLSIFSQILIFYVET
jgi:hypothetical protein